MRAAKMLEAVAHLLSLMAAAPNLRDRPQPGDRPGAFTHWFDGGAIHESTGYTLYEFANDAWAVWSPSAPRVLLQLPDGTAWSLVRENADRPVSTLPQVRCPQCQFENAADSRFCSQCGQSLLPPGVAPAEARSLPALETIPPAPPTTRKCPHCHAPNKLTAHFCLTCGKPLPAVVTASMPPQPPASTAEKICPKCQAANTAAAHHCRNCGASLA